MTHNVVIPTVYGPMIVNRHGTEFDNLAKYGTSVDHESILIYGKLISCLGSQPLILDIGACFGCFSLGWAKILEPLAPRIIAFEPQQWLANCICGSVALNDLENVIVMNTAVGDHNGIATVPKVNYELDCSFGSLPMVECTSPNKLDCLGQVPSGSMQVDMLAIDMLRLSPSAIKIDVEGMEVNVLVGGERTIMAARPIIFAEHIKSNPKELATWFADHNYQINVNDGDLICIPKEKLGLFPVMYNDVVLNEETGKFSKTA